MTIANYFIVGNIPPILETIITCILGYIALIVFLGFFIFVNWFSTADLPFQSIEEFEKELIKSGLATKESLQGCNEAEIQQIMKSQNVDTLPLYYREFLQIAGKNFGKLKIGTNFHYPDILNIRALVDKDLLKHIPDNTFIFGYSEDEIPADETQSNKTIIVKTVGYFYIDKRDNPRIYFIDNHDLESGLVHPTFLHLLAHVCTFQAYYQDTNH